MKNITKQIRKNSALIVLAIFIFIVAASFFVFQSSWPLFGNTDPGKKLQACNLTDEKCFGSNLLTISRTKTPQKALEFLEKMSKEDPEFLFLCHNLAHVVGSDAYLRFGDAQKAFGYSNGVCEYGYQHGVISVARQELSDPQIIPILCDTVEGPRYVRLNCFHGLGHGLLVNRDYNLSSALADCELVPNQREKEVCWGGVFMENAVPKHLKGPAVPQRLADIFSFCNQVDEKYKRECYFFGFQGGDFDNAVDLCRTLSNNRERIYCYEGVSTNLVPRKAQFEKNLAIDICASALGEVKQSCFSIVALSFLKLDGKIEGGAEFCHMAPEKYKSACFRKVGEFVPLFTDSNKNSWTASCQKIAGVFRQECVVGAEKGEEAYQGKN